MSKVAIALKNYKDAVSYLQKHEKLEIKFNKDTDILEINE